MAHEKSETVKIGNRWFNRTTVGSDKGRILGRKDGFATMEDAVRAAKKRSASFLVPRRKPGRSARVLTGKE